MNYFKTLKFIIFCLTFYNLFGMEDQTYMPLKVALVELHNKQLSFEVLESSKEPSQIELELGRYASYAAVFSGERVIFTDLKKNDKTYDPYLSMLLYGAALKGHVEVVRKILISKNVDVNYHGDVKGNTPLIAAIKSGHIEVAKLLLQHPKINLLVSNLKKITPLHATKGRISNTEIIKLILECGDFWNFFLYKNGKSLLTKAVTHENLEIVKIIASKWPNFINVKDDKGKTPLDYAQIMHRGRYFNSVPTQVNLDILNFLEETASKQITTQLASQKEGQK